MTLEEIIQVRVEQGMQALRECKNSVDGGVFSVNTMEEYLRENGFYRLAAEDIQKMGERGEVNNFIIKQAIMTLQPEAIQAILTPNPVLQDIPFREVEPGEILSYKRIPIANLDEPHPDEMQRMVVIDEITPMEKLEGAFFRVVENLPQYPDAFDENPIISAEEAMAAYRLAQGEDPPAVHRLKPNSIRSYEFSTEDLEQDIENWANYNFPGEDADTNFMGMMEEMGEIAHERLKDRMGIRGSHEEHMAKIKDGVGDLFIFMTAFCRHNGFTLEDAVRETWNKVRTRDWRKFPNNGVDK